MDQGAPEAVRSGKGSRTEAGGATADGLAPYVEAVEAARERLGRDLEQLNVEVRAQVSHTVERTVWKVAAASAAVVAGLAARKLLDLAWRKTRKSAPPDDPADLGTGFREALAWTVATAVGAAVAQLVARRGVAAGWKKATGTPPPA